MVKPPKTPTISSLVSWQSDLGKHVLTEERERHPAIHKPLPARIFLWNDMLVSASREKRYRPKDENALSNYVKLHLERELKERGIIAMREVEIRHAVGGDPGEFIDLYVDAWMPGPDHTRIDILTLIRGDIRHAFT